MTAAADDMMQALAASGLQPGLDDLAVMRALWDENLPRLQALRAMDFDEAEAPLDAQAFAAATLDVAGLASLEAAATAQVPAARDLAEASADPTQWDLATLRQALRARRIGARELTQAYLDRQARFDPRLRTSVTLRAEQALLAADASDRRLAAGRAALLEGLPLGVKDCIAVAGTRLTAGSRVFGERTSVRHAACVQALHDAGASVLATQSMHEFGAGPALADGQRATGRNPWQLELIPGGSSSGSAAAVSSGLCAAALGTDSAGSVRIPAAFCGLVGVKPTRGAVPTDGVVPYVWSLDHVGTLTRTAEDAALLLAAVGRTPALQALADDATRRGCLEQGVQGLRIGVPRRLYLDSPDIDPQMRAAADDALHLMARLGARIVTVDTPSLERSDVMYTTLLAESYAYHAPRLATVPERYSAWLRVQLLLPALWRAEDVMRARRLQGRLLRECLSLFEQVDVLMYPGMAGPPTPFQSSFLPALTQPRSRFTRPWNVTGLPALALPCGFFQGGVPMSLQLAARPHAEPLLLRVARAYERETPWHRCRPDEARWND